MSASSKQLESAVERKFVELCRQIGLVTIKLNLQGNAGWPDRLVLLPGQRVVWVELKRPGETVRPLQDYRHAYLRGCGHAVIVADDASAAVGAVLVAARRT